MRLGTLSAFLGAIVLGACTTGPAPFTEADQENLKGEVVARLGDLTKALNSHDPEEIFSFYRQDGSFLYLGCTDVLSGWGTFASRVGPYYVNHDEVSFEQEILSIQILSPTVAVAAMRGSSSEAEALFWTEVLQKSEDGQWLITYEHESWPGCPVPRGPHMGTTGGEGMEMGGPGD